MRKFNLIWIMILFIPFTYATAPEFTTLTPADDYIVLGDNQTDLTAIATDSEGDPVNYTFWIETGVYMDNATEWTGGGMTNQGTSFANMNKAQIYCSNCNVGGTRSDVVINQDTLWIYWRDFCEYCYPSAKQFTIYIDGDIVFYYSTRFDASGYEELDTSPYNDGLNHTIYVKVRNNGGSSDTYAAWWWFPQYTNESATIEELSFAYPQSNNTIFTLNKSGGGGTTSYTLEPKAWRVTASDNNSENTTSEWRDIYFGDFYNCSDDSSNIALNFTIETEQTSALITSDITTDFDLVTDTATTFDFDLAGQNNYSFCLTPPNVDVTLNGFINYQPEDSTTFPFARQYWFTDAIIRGDTTNDITLYVLNGSVSEPVTFIVTLDGQSINGKVWVQRYLSGTYTLVGMVDITTGGSNSLDLRTVDTFYKFLVYDVDNVLLGTFGPMTISDTVALNTFSSQIFDTSWRQYIQLRDYNYSFSYSNTTNISDLTYSHSSGLSTQDCLRIVYSEFLNDSQVCYTCSSSASATLQCLITDQDATYTLQYVTLLNGTWFIRAAEQLSLKETLADKIGNDGLFFSFLLIGILAFVGLFNPAAAVWFSMGGLIFVTLLGLINLSITALVGLLFVGGLIAVKLRT